MFKNWEAAISKRVDRLQELVGEDREIVDGWVKYMGKDKGRSNSTVLTYLDTVISFARWWGKSLDEFTVDDAIEYKNYVRENSKKPSNRLAGPRLYLKYRCWRDNRILLNDRYRVPEICEGFKLWEINNRPEATKIREMPVLSGEDINTLIGIAQRTPFTEQGEIHVIKIALLYASGFRMSEFLSMNVENLFWEDGTLKARCPESKTIPRTVDIIWGVQLIEKIIAIKARMGAKPKDPLWTTRTGKRLNSLDNSLRRIVARAPREVREKFSRAGSMAHLFRHSRLTHLARQGYDIYTLRDFGGWSDFKMPNHYIHRVNGLATNKKFELPDVTIKECPACGFGSFETYRYCPQCGTGLGKEAAQDQDAKTQIETDIKGILGDPDVTRLIREKLEERRQT